MELQNFIKKYFNSCNTKIKYNNLSHFIIQELILDPASVNQIATFNIEKEVSAALESVIPRAALGPFVYLNPSEKVTQLVELSNLVIGIRLFNKELGKGMPITI